MTDTKAKSSIALAAAHSLRGAAMETDTAVALRIACDYVAVFEFYKRYLAEHIRGNPIDDQDFDAAELECQFARLSDFAGLIVLLVIWKASDCITSNDLTCAGLPDTHRCGITRNTLGGALLASDRGPVTFDTVAMFARRASRIVEAAMTYGLVEETLIRPNYKPLRATRKLHELMTEFGSAAAKLILAPFRDTSCGIPPSSNGIAGAAK